MSVNDAMNNLNRKSARALNVYAESLRAEIYGTLERNRVGRGIQWPGNPNPSSAPGDPPARQSGRLMESIAVTKRATPNDLRSEVGPRPQSFTNQPPYPVFLEFGLQEFGTRRMAPRPFMRPSISALLKKVRNIRIF